MCYRPKGCLSTQDTLTLTRNDPAHVCVPSSSNNHRNGHPQMVIRVRIFCRMFDRTAHISLHFSSDFKELASEETSSGGETTAPRRR